MVDFRWDHWVKTCLKITCSRQMVDCRLDHWVKICLKTTYSSKKQKLMIVIDYPESFQTNTKRLKGVGIACNYNSAIV